MIQKAKNVKYYNIRQWRKAEPKAYQAAIRFNLLPMICQRFNWEHTYPNALNYSLRPLGLCYKNIKKLKKEHEILDVTVIKRKKELMYKIDIKECRFNWYREMIIVDKLKVAVGLCSEYVGERIQKKMVNRFGCRVSTFYLDCKLLNPKEVKKNYSQTFEKQSIIYDKIIDYLLGEKFAHLKIN